MPTGTIHFSQLVNKCLCLWVERHHYLSDGLGRNGCKVSYGVGSATEVGGAVTQLPLSIT